ncbi:hypothetical protein Cni_G12962 [Canna indica]|uniref:Uncharacterized protein n=1 Tax=Canna indica TaxID=4628 RepID=A0AAQ3KEE0_9LILI|nr:hypothetical protein Cni_G12962 [Canna indica]
MVTDGGVCGNDGAGPQLRIHVLRPTPMKIRAKEIMNSQRRSRRKKCHAKCLGLKKPWGHPGDRVNSDRENPRAKRALEMFWIGLKETGTKKKRRAEKDFSQKISKYLKNDRVHCKNPRVTKQVDKRTTIDMIGTSMPPNCQYSLLGQ